MNICRWLINLFRKKESDDGVIFGKESWNKHITSTHRIELEKIEEAKPMKQIKLKAKVIHIDGSNISLEFGRTQAEMTFSSKGSIARKLKPKEGDILEVTLGIKEVKE